MSADWPHTNRVLPWALAGFLALLWLIPFDAVRLPVRLPFDAAPDRVALVALVALWICVAITGGRHAPHVRLTAVHWALLVYLLVAVLSLLINLERAGADAELGLAAKRLALLMAYVAFFLVVASTLRPGELRSFGTLILLLATLTAIGTIWELRGNFNAFYEWTRSLIPGADVRGTPGGVVAGRRVIVGPTQHGLALAAMLAMALPLAIVRFLDARDLPRRILLAVIAMVILGGALATARKTAVFAPATALLVVAVYRPAAVLRLVGIVAVGVLGVLLLIPDAVASLREQLALAQVLTSDSSQGRLDDYAALAPDLLSHPFLGRGYGAFDVFAVRILDNEYLSQLVMVGVIGTLAFVAVILAALAVAHPVVRSRTPERSQVALAAAAAAFTFGVVGVLFDATSFPQVSYSFLLFAALAAVAGTAERA